VNNSTTIAIISSIAIAAFTLIGCGNSTENTACSAYSLDAISPPTSKEPASNEYNSITKLLASSENKFAVVKCADYVYIRSTTDLANSEIIGRTNDGNIIEIEEEKNGWAKLKLDENINAYIKSSFISVLDSTSSLVREITIATVTSNEMVLNVYKTKSSDAETIGYAFKDRKYEVVETLDDWVKISFKDGNGYIQKDYVSLSKEYPIIKSVKDITSDVK